VVVADWQRSDVAKSVEDVVTVWVGDVVPYGLLEVHVDFYLWRIYCVLVLTEF
jgi:hypothetical protein